MKKPKILYGICGLGNGHTQRQLPIVEHFANTAEIMIFAHDNSYDFYASYFRGNPSVKVIRVAMPFYAGDKHGINFGASATSPRNQKNTFQVNCAALDTANKKLSKPDLVITDYEPISAQYAYAHNTPLVTIDQQSKFLCGDFPKELAGLTFTDEIMRLHMFFPRAGARIAVSFFKFPLRSGAEKVHVFPATIKKEITKIKRGLPQNSILVYLSSARKFPQTPEQIMKILAKQKLTRFHLFFERGIRNPKKFFSSSVHVYKHGDPRFPKALKECSGIITTAGHSLISEAMYLGIPVYAIPLGPYEQHLNALVIEKNGFGISYPQLEMRKLQRFLSGIPKFRQRIKEDKNILMRQAGQKQIIQFIESNFL